MDDEIKPGMTTQTPQWWVSLAVVVAMDELKIVVHSWKCNNESGPQHGTLGWSWGISSS